MGGPSSSSFPTAPDTRNRHAAKVRAQAVASHPQTAVVMEESRQPTPPREAGAASSGSPRTPPLRSDRLEDIVGADVSTPDQIIEELRTRARLIKENKKKSQRICETPADATAV